MAEWDGEGEPREQGNAQEERKKKYREKYKGLSLGALAKAFQQSYARKDAAEMELKEANDEHDVLRFELIPSKMEEDGVEKISYEGIGRVQLAADIRLQCAAAQKPGFLQWCRKNKLEDLWKMDINSSTLKAFIKARIKAGKELPPDDLVKVEPITRASITKG
jgi:hypothetical protein